jgi:prevent-host-death family protein
MASVYSAYEAKAKLGEILRKVQGGGRVVITYRGRPVAEVRPLTEDGGDLATRLERLTEAGVVTRTRPTGGVPRPVARREGALRRFLESRE